MDACGIRCCWKCIRHEELERRSYLTARRSFLIAIRVANLANKSVSQSFSKCPQQSKHIIQGVLAVTTDLINSTDTVELFKQYVIPNYVRYPVNLVRGEGSSVWDSEGKRYLDLFPGWGCNLLGHCPPAIVDQLSSLRRRRCASRKMANNDLMSTQTRRP